MKKITVLLLLFALIFTFSGCKGGDNSSSEADKTYVSQTDGDSTGSGSSVIDTSSESDLNNTKTYDAYVNGIGYDLETILTVDIVLKTNDKEITICPCWTAYQKINDTWQPYNIEKAVGIDNIYGEDIGVYSTSGSPIQTDDGAVYGNWAWLANENAEPFTGDYSGGKVIKRIKFKVCDKGEFKIEVKDGMDADQNDNKYTDSLSLNIHK